MMKEAKRIHAFGKGQIEMEQEEHAAPSDSGVGSKEASDRHQDKNIGVGRKGEEGFGTDLKEEEGDDGEGKRSGKESKGKDDMPLSDMFQMTDILENLSHKGGSQESEQSSINRGFEIFKQIGDMDGKEEDGAKKKADPKSDIVEKMMFQIPFKRRKR